MVQFDKLRLSGFKSFVDPTELAIEPGMTGIVGPNGCGKSNLVEAMKWVYRDYPLNNPAYLAAVLAHCASPLRYFGLVDTLFKSQDYWATPRRRSR